MFVNSFTTAGSRLRIGLLLGLLVLPGCGGGATTETEHAVQMESATPGASSATSVPKPIAVVEDPSPQPMPFGVPPDAIRATVTRVVDGVSFFVLQDGGSREIKVRYIGLEVPMVHAEDNAVYEAMALEANSALLSGADVYLVHDVSEADVQGRLLRYVYLSDGTFANAELLAGGWAEAVPIAPDLRHADLFRTLQGEAMQASLGLWSIPTPTPRVTSTSFPTATPRPRTANSTPKPSATSASTWYTAVSGPVNGVTGKLTLSARRTTYQSGESIWFTMDLVNTNAAPVPYGVLGVTAADLDSSDGQGGQFHLSWDGQGAPGGLLNLNPGKFVHRDRLALTLPGRYALRLSLCFSPFPECVNGLGWTTLSPDIQIVVNP